MYFSSSLLNYLNEGVRNSDSTTIIGVIPKTDQHKVNILFSIHFYKLKRKRSKLAKCTIFQIDDVIGTVGVVRSVIQIGLAPEEFFVIVQGICRFQLDTTISEEPIKINKIKIIENFKELSGGLIKILMKNMLLIV